MTNLTISIKHLASLNRAPGATWTEATKRKAPHKPLLLLAVLDLVHRGVITAPFIAVTGDRKHEAGVSHWHETFPSTTKRLAPSQLFQSSLTQDIAC